MSNPYKTIYELRETIAELSERCREQEADIEELLKEREWISVKDRMPEEGEVVLVYNAKLDSMHIEYPLYLGEPKLHFDADVTHWQYLPEKPESEDDAE